MSVTILVGDALETLRTLPDESVSLICTSPPYWRQRSYLDEDDAEKHREIGTEKTPEEYVASLTQVFAECRRVLRSDGSCWINIGDKWAAGGHGGGGSYVAERSAWAGMASKTGWRSPPAGYKRKDLIGLPFMLAFAMRADGWYWRSCNVWAKCLSGGAWVYARTQKGEMPVMVKDLVRLDPRTVSLWNGSKWTRVLGWGTSADDSERLEIVLRSGERIGCTGEHRWPTSRGNVAAQELRIGDAIATCQLPESDGARPQFLTDDVLWMVGLYLAEGSRSGETLQFSLSADEQAWVPRLAAIAKHYGGSCAHTVDGGKLSVRVWGRVIGAIVATYIGGAVALDKHLKVVAWRLPNDALRMILQGYLDGDGHGEDHNGRWRLGFCRNYALERDLRTAAARLGATLTLKPGVAAFQSGESPTFKGEWRWERSGHKNEKDRGEIIEIRASRARHFWDIAVEDEPHLFALASGVLTHNSNGMPESTDDRPVVAHEYVLQFAKGEDYYWVPEAVRLPAVPESLSRLQRAMRANMDAGALVMSGGGYAPPGQPAHQGARRSDKQLGHSRRHDGFNDRWDAMSFEEQRANGAALRSVWWLPVSNSTEAHFAVMPEELAAICILSGCPPGETVLDPFLGSGTAAVVAERLGRDCIGIELNAEFAAIAERRCREPGFSLA